MSETSDSLVTLLDQAQQAKPGAASKFFQALLHSMVFIPVNERPEEGARPEGKIWTPFGVNGPVPLVVNYEGKKIIPIFSEKEFADEWAGDPVSSVEEAFTVLLNMGTSEVWLHLNPGQAVGKELSPWEIELLRNGPEAIPEIVAELPTGVPEDIEVNRESDLYPELKRRIKVLLEVYPQIEEAFLIAIKRGDEEKAEPVLGLKQVGLIDEQLKSINEELLQIAADTEGESTVASMVDDLNDQASYNWALFTDTTPFYMKLREVPQRETFVQRLLSRVGVRK